MGRGEADVSGGGEGKRERGKMDRKKLKKLTFERRKGKTEVSWRYVWDGGAICVRWMGNAHSGSRGLGGERGRSMMRYPQSNTSVSLTLYPVKD